MPMFRFLVLAGLLGAASCATDDNCGQLTLQLGEDVSAYPASTTLSCELHKGSYWNKAKNEAGLLLTSSDLPADAHIAAVLSLDMVKPGMTLSVPTGVAGEAFTNGMKNDANLTSGTVIIQKDVGVDTSITPPARVFFVKWDLEWLGAGTYQSHGESTVWFNAIGAL